MSIANTVQPDKKLIEETLIPEIDPSVVAEMQIRK